MSNVTAKEKGSSNNIHEKDWKCNEGRSNNNRNNIYQQNSIWLVTKQGIDAKSINAIQHRLDIQYEMAASGLGGSNVGFRKTRTITNNDSGGNDNRGLLPTETASCNEMETKDILERDRINIQAAIGRNQSKGSYSFVPLESTISASKTRTTTKYVVGPALLENLNSVFFIMWKNGEYKGKRF